jgi:hypothetical protein
MDIHSLYLFSFFSAYGSFGRMQNGHSSFPDKIHSTHIGGCGRFLAGDSGEISGARAVSRNSHWNVPVAALRKVV